MALLSGYKLLKYIESSGTQYIDTGVNGNNDNLEISIKFHLLSWSSYCGIYGNYNSESSNATRMISQTSDNGKYYTYSNTSAGKGSTSITALQNDINEVTVSSTQVTVNGVSKAVTNTTKGDDNNNNIAIFNLKARVSGCTTMRLYSFKIADNGVLVRDFVPVKRISDGAVGLYDSVNDQFYTNAGTGTFIAGDEIPPAEFRIPVDSNMMPVVDLEIPVMSKRVKLTNLVPSMDSLSFEVRSSSGSCEMSTAHSKYGSKALCNIGVSGYNEMYAMTTTNFKLIPSHIYYACVEIYQETRLGSIDFFFPSGSPSMFGGKVPGDAGTWRKWDVVTNRSTFTEGEYPIRLDFNNGGTEGRIWYDGLMLIDLTAAFGVGNEPTYEWCNQNISYFTGTTNVDIPLDSPIQMKVVSISANGVLIFSKGNDVRYTYVSLGDSIAAGHMITDDWETVYGRQSQYNRNGNTTTVIVPDCYTDLFKRELISEHGEDKTSVTSFARSGDTVEDLMNILTHESVKNAVKVADFVTISIGANDVLTPALSHLEEYISTGEYADLEVEIEENLALLNNDNYEYSYKKLFDTLTELNPNAKFVLTTVYNPYKYLYIEGGRDGFFKPMFDSIPEYTIDVDGTLKHELGVTLPWNWDISLDNTIKDAFNIAIAVYVARLNNVSDLAENWVTQLNQVLTSKVNAYKSLNPNILLVDTKALFDTYPDRPVEAEIHYNDLVNVEFTRGFDRDQAKWGNLWEGHSSRDAFWVDLFTRHTRIKNALPSINPLDYVEFRTEDCLNELIPQVVTKVIQPDIDPHPEPQGHVVLKQSFESALS